MSSRSPRSAIRSSAPPSSDVRYNVCSTAHCAPVMPKPAKYGSIVRRNSPIARSHDRTWLRIAVEESALLSSAVAIDEPSGAAALLAPLDRSRLLSALWLLTAPAGRAPLAVRLEPGQGGGVELALVAAGIRARDLDRSVWGILSEIGEHRTTTDHGATRIRVAHRPRRRTTT